MINLYQEFYQNSKECAALQRAIGIQCEKLIDAVADLKKQFFVESATWGLEYWERFLGLPVSPKKKEQNRREIILAHLRSYRVTTKELIYNIASGFSNGEIEIIEDFENYEFTINFISQLGVPENIEQLKAVISKVKPAHLNCIYKFLFRKWNEVENLKWNDVSNLTWNELKEREGVINNETN